MSGSTLTRGRWAANLQHVHKTEGRNSGQSMHRPPTQNKPISKTKGTAQATCTESIHTQTKKPPI
uniref:Uncharacterized protein n=1 Tax=Anguilla anguilla TaxID=7936 RepID=A0A0E9XCM1_ANGAN